MEERTIQQAVLEHLSEIIYYEDRSDPSKRVGEADEGACGVGVPYDVILRRVHEEFPSSRMKLNDIRRLAWLFRQTGELTVYRRQRVKWGQGDSNVR